MFQWKCSLELLCLKWLSSFLWSLCQQCRWKCMWQYWDGLCKHWRRRFLLGVELELGLGLVVLRCRRTLLCRLL